MLHCLLLSLVLTAPTAQAADAEWTDAECKAFCEKLDAVEESCEALYGDGDTMCEAIGTVEEQCDDGSAGGDDSETDGGSKSVSDPTCAGICERVDALDDQCDSTLGDDHDVCEGLNALADGVCETDDDEGAVDEGEGEDDDDDCDGEHEHEDGDRGKSDSSGGGIRGALGCASAPAPGALGILLAAGLIGVGRRRE